VGVFLRDLRAAGRPAARQRSYAMDLLRWFRFCWAIGVSWDHATRSEARDFSRWIQAASSAFDAHRLRDQGSRARMPDLMGRLVSSYRNGDETGQLAVAQFRRRHERRHGIDHHDHILRG
jgi:hypothetical protein